MFWVVVAVVLLAFSIYWAVKEKMRSPPGPFRLPLIGNLITLLANDYRYYDWTLGLRQQYGSVFSLKALGVPEITIISDPKCAHYILVENFANYPKGAHQAKILQPLLGDGIFNVDGEKWEKQRKVASYMFSQAYLKYMTNVFAEHAVGLSEVFAKAAASGQVLDTVPLFSSYTIDCFIEVAFGEKVDTLNGTNDAAVAKAFTDALVMLDHRFFTPGWEYMPWSATEKKLRVAITAVNAWVADIILKRRSVSETHREDLISYFIRLKDETMDTSDDKFLREMAINFMLAGRDTTAATLTWLMYEVAKNPKIEEKLRAEIISTYPGNAVPDFDSLKKLPYLKACMDETLRMYPPVPFDVKMPKKDDTLPNGMPVKAGSFVIWSSLLLGRDPAVYDCPNEFRPERWLGENGGKPTPQPQTAGAIPFQTGPRTCLGMNMAYIEVKLVVATLMQRFKFSIPPGFVGKWRRAITLGVEGEMKMLVKKL